MSRATMTGIMAMLSLIAMLCGLCLSKKAECRSMERENKVLREQLKVQDQKIKRLLRELDELETAVWADKGTPCTGYEWATE